MHNASVEETVTLNKTLGYKSISLILNVIDIIIFYHDLKTFNENKSLRRTKNQIKGIIWKID